VGGRVDENRNFLIKIKVSDFFYLNHVFFYLNRFFLNSDFFLYKLISFMEVLQLLGTTTVTGLLILPNYSMLCGPIICLCSLCY